jgi:adenylate kinase
MIISMTGAPGTGKTVVSKILAKRIGANLIDIRDLIEEEKIHYTMDRKRNTKVVSTIDLRHAVEKKINPKKVNIIEGHLSHFMESDLVFIMRCNPVELKRRLEKRSWNEAKIKENLQAEILDQITIEALDGADKKQVYEIDTSGKTAGQTASLVMKILKYSSLKRYERLLAKYRPGGVDWSENYKKFLMK